jgi:hypothetical protein
VTEATSLGPPSTSVSLARTGSEVAPAPSWTPAWSSTARGGSSTPLTLIVTLAPAMPPWLSVTV